MLNLPLKINAGFSLNAVYGGIHWARRRHQAKQIHELVGLELRRQLIPHHLATVPVSVHFSWNSNLDLDNHGYLAKLIIDGLKGYVIKDDSKPYIKGISHEYWDGPGVSVTVMDS